jgi:hypothetical protein
MTLKFIFDNKNYGVVIIDSREKRREMEKEKPQAQKVYEAVESMIDPNTFHPPFEQYEVTFKFWPGDKVNVEGLFEGVVTACAINSTGGKVTLVDNGRMSRWYAESVVRSVYYHTQLGKDEPKPLR